MSDTQTGRIGGRSLRFSSRPSAASCVVTGTALYANRADIPVLSAVIPALLALGYVIVTLKDGSDGP